MKKMVISKAHDPDPRTSAAAFQSYLPLFLEQQRTMPAPATFLGYIDENADRFIQRLADAVAIPR
jgi:hypothetical protein